jgi:hypothetical protein
MNNSQLPAGNYVTWPKWATSALVLYMLTSFSGGIWYMATMESRMSHVERTLAGSNNIDNRLTRLEERFVSLQNHNA